MGTRAAKEAGEAAEEAVKQSTKDALEDTAGETAIGNLDGIEGIGKSGSNTKVTFASDEKLLSHYDKHGGEF